MASQQGQVGVNAERPLSPHLTVYRPLMGAFTSILHRAMNTALLVGCGFLVMWLVAVAQGGDLFRAYNSFLGSVVGRAMLFGWTFAACYSAAQWVRHLFWDLGYGFELETARKTGHAAIWGSTAVTLLVWLIVVVR